MTSSPCPGCGGDLSDATARAVCHTCMARLRDQPGAGALRAVELALQERERHSRSLLRFSRRLELARGYADVVAAASEEVKAVIGYSNCWIYLFDDDRQYARAVVVHGAAEDAIFGDDQIATLTIPGDPMLEEIAAAHDIVVIEEASQDPRTNKQIVAKLGNRSIVNVPTILFDRHLGSLGMGTFGDEGVRVPTDEEKVFLRALASHVAVTLDRIHQLRQRRRAEEKVRKLNEELERRVAERTAELAQANSELEAFAYSVSHDLRAPLRHIAGFIELLRRDLGEELDSSARHHVEVITDAAQRMGGMIDDLLAFSRMTRRELVTTQLDMTALVREVFEEVRATAPTRNVTLRLGELPEGHGDSTMVRHLLVNLLANAVKFTALREAALIEVGGEVGGEVNTYSVKDNGVGFDMRYVDKLFGVFQRLHRAEDFEGTGIGLAIVKRIALRHGGRVWAEGRVGEGARFCFTLTRAKAAVRP